MAVAERERGNNDRAAALFERSRAINERLGNRAGAANSLSNLGMVYQDFGRNDRALEAYPQEPRGHRRHRRSCELREYARQSRLPVSRSGRRYGRPRLLQPRARALRATGPHHRHRTDSRLPRSCPYISRRIRRGRALYRRARELRQSSGDRAGLANVEIEIGALRQAQGDLDAALAQYQRGIAMFDELGERRSLSYVLMRLANVRQLRGASTVRRSRPRRERQRCASRPGRTPGSGRRNWRPGVRGAACRTVARRARRSSDRSRGSKRCATVPPVSRRVASARSKTRPIPYREMVALLVEAGQPDAALTFAERAKGRVLLDVLRHGRADVNRVMTPAERAEERRLNAATAEAAQRLQRLGEPGRATPEHWRRRARLARGADARRSRSGPRVYTAHPELSGQRSEAPRCRRRRAGGDGPR